MDRKAARLLTERALARLPAVEQDGGAEVYRSYWSSDGRVNWTAEDYGVRAFQRKFVAKWFGEADKDRIQEWLAFFGEVYGPLREVVSAKSRLFSLGCGPGGEVFALALQSVALAEVRAFDVANWGPTLHDLVVAFSEEIPHLQDSQMTLNGEALGSEAWRPCNIMDPRDREQVYEAVAAEREGLTIITISHLLSHLPPGEDAAEFMRDLQARLGTDRPCDIFLSEERPMFECFEGSRDKGWWAVCLAEGFKQANKHAKNLYFYTNRPPSDASSPRSQRPAPPVTRETAVDKARRRWDQARYGLQPDAQGRADALLADLEVALPEHNGVPQRIAVAAVRGEAKTCSILQGVGLGAHARDLAALVARWQWNNRAPELGPVEPAHHRESLELAAKMPELAGLDLILSVARRHSRVLEPLGKGNSIEAHLELGTKT